MLRLYEQAGELLRQGIWVVCVDEKTSLQARRREQSPRLENWLQKQTQINGWPLEIAVYWLPTNASWLDQIEIWFSVLQRKLLTPCHFESLEDLAQAIMEFIRCQNLSPKPIQWTYTVEKLEQKLGTI